MKPGPSRILECPVCGRKKRVMTLMSGNTIGERVWSDTKRIAPMLPEISFVQKCPTCNNFYLVTNQKMKYSKDKNDYTFERGLLDFKNLCLALCQLEGRISHNDETTIRMMIIHAFNDNYRNQKEDIKPVSDEDIHTFESTAKKILETMEWNEKNLLFKAELYREIGDFQESVNILTSIPSKDNFEEVIRQEILRKAQIKDNIVFLLNPLLETKTIGSQKTESKKIVPDKKLNWIERIKQFISWGNTSK
jgi:hypothetical protein